MAIMGFLRSSRGNEAKHVTDIFYFLSAPLLALEPPSPLPPETVAAANLECDPLLSGTMHTEPCAGLGSSRA